MFDCSLILPGLTPKGLSSKYLDVYLAWNNEEKEFLSIYTKNLDNRELLWLKYGAHKLEDQKFKKE